MSAAWRIFTQNWFVLTFTLVLYEVITQALGLVGYTARQAGIESGASGLSMAGSVTQFVVGSYLQVGLVQISLAAARGQSPSFAMLFGGVHRLWPMVGSTLLIMVVVFVGFLMLIVPGVILLFGLSMAGYFVVDAGLGPVAALKASWAATRGHKAMLFGFGFLAGLVLIGGLLALLVGVFPAMAVVSVAMAVIYTRLTGTGVANLEGSASMPR